MITTIAKTRTTRSIVTAATQAQNSARAHAATTTTRVMRMTRRRLTRRRRPISVEHGTGGQDKGSRGAIDWERTGIVNPRVVAVGGKRGGRARRRVQHGGGHWQRTLTYRAALGLAAAAAAVAE